MELQSKVPQILYSPAWWQELIHWHGFAPIHPACSSGSGGWGRANTNEAAKTNILSALTKVSFY